MEAAAEAGVWERCLRSTVEKYTESLDLEIDLIDILAEETSRERLRTVAETAFRQSQRIVLIRHPWPLGSDPNYQTIL